MATAPRLPSVGALEAQGAPLRSSRHPHTGSLSMHMHPTSPPVTGTVEQLQYERECVCMCVRVCLYSEAIILADPPGLVGTSSTKHYASRGSLTQPMGGGGTGGPVRGRRSFACLLLPPSVARPPTRASSHVHACSTMCECPVACLPTYNSKTCLTRVSGFSWCQIVG